MWLLIAALSEQHVTMRFCFMLGKYYAEIVVVLKQAYKKKNSV